MPRSNHHPSQAEFLADLVTGNAGMAQAGASVQRSHRFPLQLFVQIENLAKMGKVPVSLIINQLIECGLVALKENLPPDALAKVTRVTQEQLDQPVVADKVDVPWNLETGRGKRPRSKK